MLTFFEFYLIVLLAVSLITFLAYGIDKYKAKRGRYRISEAFLLGAAFCCGAMGALLGMRVFHHKTKHWYFWVVNLLALALQIAWGVYLYLHPFS